MTSFPPRPQNKYNFPPPGHRWWKTHKGAMTRLFWDLKWHSQEECLEAGGHRFGGIIRNLRAEGWDIETQPTGNTQARNVFRYRLVTKIKGPPEEERRRLYLSETATRALADGKMTAEAITVAQKVLGRIK